MTSTERVLTALKGEQPDRVPVMEFLMDIKVARAIFPDCRESWECMDRLGMDAVGTGAFFEKKPADKYGIFVDEWGVTYRRNAESVAHPVSGPISTRADARNYQPPDPEHPDRLGQLPEIVSRFKHKRAITFHHRAAFMWAAYLCDLDNLLIDMLIDPEKVNIVMDKVLKTNMRIVQRAIQAGAEVIVLGDDYAHNLAPLMSPELFERFILPRLKQMIDLIHAEGALCVKHSDGNIMPLLEMILSAGPDGLNPIEPVAGMDLEFLKKTIGKQVCLLGNIDCARLLPFGRPAEVTAAVKKAISTAGKDGGYIVTSSNSIHSGCKPENVIAMVQAVQEFGEYPISQP